MDRRSIHATRFYLGEKAANLADRWGLKELSNTLDSRFRAGSGTVYSLRKQLLRTESFATCAASQSLAPCANVFVSVSGEERAIDHPLAMSRRRSAVLEAGGSVRGSEAPMDTENLPYACISQKYR